MKAEILTIGTELLLGQVIDTNSAFLGLRLAELGIPVYFRTTVGDNEKRLAAALRTALGRADLVIATGGLGPTVDDITKKVFCRYFKTSLRLDPKILAHVRGIFARRAVPMPACNEDQAWVPRDARIIPNPLGTAPGIIFKKRGKTAVLLPGVPTEMKAMFEATVAPYLREKASEGIIVSRVLKCFGLPESAVDELIRDLFISSENPSIALLASWLEVKVRLTAKAATPAKARAMIAKTEKKVRSVLKDNIFAADEGTMARTVGGLLRKKKLRLTVAESCTGGLLTQWITAVPGSSNYLDRAFVTYSNRSKQELLGVPAATLERFGAVSRQTALAMAQGARRESRADLGLSVTGIAGPGGATQDKPVGLVYIGLAGPGPGGGCRAWEYRFSGDRAGIRERSAQTALDHLRRVLLPISK